MSDVQLEADRQLDGRDATEATADYQSLSGAAIVALGLALLSPAAFAAPLLYVVPLAAAGLALLALSRIRNSGGALAGARVAYWALALAVACGVASFVRGEVRDRLMHRQAAAAAGRWFERLAEGRTEDAFELLSPQAAFSLQPEAEPNKEPIAPEQAKAIALERLRTDALAVALQKFGTPLRFAVLDDSAAPVFEGGRSVLSGVYQVGPSADGQSRAVQLQLLRHESYEANGEPWRVHHWEDVEPRAAGAAGS